MNFYKFKLIDGYYCDDVNSGDSYLIRLSDIFDNGTGWANSVKRSLLDPTSLGVTGNKADVDIIGNVVKIFPQFVDNPEDYEIEIDRQLLLNLINKWLKLVKQKAPEIYFIRYNDSRIEVSDHLA